MSFLRPLWDVSDNVYDRNECIQVSLSIKIDGEFMS